MKKAGIANVTSIWGQTLQALIVLAYGMWHHWSPGLVRKLVMPGRACSRSCVQVKSGVKQAEFGQTGRGRVRGPFLQNRKHIAQWPAHAKTARVKVWQSRCLGGLIPLVNRMVICTLHTRPVAQFRAISRASTLYQSGLLAIEWQFLGTGAPRGMAMTQDIHAVTCCTSVPARLPQQ
jgi:hypothetical protein